MKRACREFLREAHRVVDGESCDVHEFLGAEHARECRACANEWKRLQRVDEALWSLPRPRLSAHEVESWVAVAMERADAPSGAVSTTMEDVVDPTISARSGRGLRFATAAALLLAAAVWTIASLTPSREDPVPGTVVGSGASTEHGAVSPPSPPEPVTPAFSLSEEVWAERMAKVRARRERLRAQLEDPNETSGAVLRSRHAQPLAEDLAALLSDGGPHVVQRALPLLDELARQGVALPSGWRRGLNHVLRQVSPPLTAVDWLVHGGAPTDALERAGEHPALQHLAHRALAADPRTPLEVLRGVVFRPKLPITEETQDEFRELLRALPSNRRDLLPLDVELAATAPAALVKERLARLDKSVREDWLRSLHGRGSLRPADALNLASVHLHAEFVAPIAQLVRRGGSQKNAARILARGGTESRVALLEMAEDRALAQELKQRCRQELAEAARQLDGDELRAMFIALENSPRLLRRFLEPWAASEVPAPVDAAALALLDSSLPWSTRSLAAEALAARPTTGAEAAESVLHELASATQPEPELERFRADLLVLLQRGSGTAAVEASLASLGVERSHRRSALLRQLRAMEREDRFANEDVRRLCADLFSQRTRTGSS